MSNTREAVQLDRIKNNIDAAYIALEALGVTVPDSATVDELAALINDAAAAHLDDVIAKRIVQTTGTATDKVMSQKAVTEAFTQKLSLTVGDDGLVYIMFNGVPVGSGVEVGSGGAISGYVDENNNIIVSGSLADGIYTVKYELGDGSIVEIGDLVIDSNVYYTVTANLTNCTSNGASQAVGGSSYTATITANSGYELKTLTVTMGGADVTASAVSGGTVIIGNVTGDIVITAVAEAQVAEPVTVDIALTDKMSIVLDANGSDRANTAGYCATPHIDLRDIPKPCTIHLTKARWAFETATESGYIRFHVADVNGTKLVGDYTHPSKMPSGVTMTLNNSMGDITVTVSSDNIGTIRFAGYWASLDYSDSNYTFAAANTKVTLTYTPAS